MCLKELDLGREIIDFMGVEGSGKTKMAELLSNLSGKPRISIGSILSDLANNDKTELGRECRAMFEEHRYMEPKTLLMILKKYFKKKKFAEGFILDGGLRTVEETKGFLDMLKEAGREMPVTVVLLKVPGWMGADRILHSTDRNRKEDTPKGILGRMEKFYYKFGERVCLIENQEGFVFLHVDARGSVEETFEKVCGVLTERVR